MKNLIQDTLAKIAKQHIVPESKGKYLLKKYGLWMIFAIILISTALAFSVILDNGKNLDWDLYRFMRQSRFAYILSILPHFWIILMVFFTAAAFWEIRKTETGYRYSWFKILSITLAGVGILGIFISLFGFGRMLNTKLTTAVPFYSRHMIMTKESQWMNPSGGFLAGTIVSVAQDQLEVSDLNGKNWQIDISGEVTIKPLADISPEKMIKIIGTKISEDNFQAREIRPWAGRGMGNGCNGEGPKGAGSRSGLPRGD